MAALPTQKQLFFRQTNAFESKPLGLRVAIGKRDNLISPTFSLVRVTVLKQHTTHKYCILK